MDKINIGHRNTFLHDETLGMRRAGISASIALRRLQDLNKERCDPPFSEDGVKSIIANVYDRREN